LTYDVNLVTEEKISQHFNEIDSNLKFKLTTENNKCISFLDLSIQRKPDKIELVIYRKETNTDTTIHNNSNHPQEQKIAAYRFYINRLITLPLTQKEKDKEWNIILKTAYNNGFTIKHIKRLKHQILTQQSKKSHDPANNNISKKIWATFTYYGGYMRGSQICLVTPR